MDIQGKRMSQNRPSYCTQPIEYRVTSRNGKSSITLPSILVPAFGRDRDVQSPDRGGQTPNKILYALPCSLLEAMSAIMLTQTTIAARWNTYQQTKVSRMLLQQGKHLCFPAIDLWLPSLLPDRN